MKAGRLSINNINIIKSKIKHVLWRLWFNHRGKRILRIFLWHEVCIDFSNFSVLIIFLKQEKQNKE